MHGASRLICMPVFISQKFQRKAAIDKPLKSTFITIDLKVIDSKMKNQSNKKGLA